MPHLDTIGTHWYDPDEGERVASAAKTAAGDLPAFDLAASNTFALCAEPLFPVDSCWGDPAHTHSSLRNGRR